MGQQVVIVPEAATLLFSGGFPRSLEPSAILAAQRAIFHVQRNLEDVQSALYPSRNETNTQALALDRRLRALWSKHPRFVLVPHNLSFFKKMSHGLAVLDGIVSDLKTARDTSPPSKRRRKS